MLICENCGTLVENNELEVYQEDMHPDGLGYCQSFAKECSCGGEFVEAEKCAVCGEFYPENSLSYGVCAECLKREATLENALAYGEEEREKITINGLFATLLTEKEIERALLEILLKNKKEGDIKKYCLLDESAFAEFLDNQRQKTALVEKIQKRMFTEDMLYD